MDMEPMPSALPNLVPEATSVPAPPTPQPWVDLTACEKWFDGRYWNTNCPAPTAIPNYPPPTTSSIDTPQPIFPEHPPAELTQPAAVAKMTSLGQAAAARANATVTPTASGAPPPAQAPVAPSALPSTGIIVGAAIGVAALLLLV